MRTENSNFICIGLIMHDILLQGINALPAHWEDMVIGKNAYSDTGGGAANSARTLGRLGADVQIAGRVGCDSLGSLIISSFHRDNVATDHLIRDPLIPSGMAVALVGNDGRRCFATVQGSNGQLSAGDFRHMDFKDYQYVHINGYFQFPSLEPHMPQLLLRAKEAGCTISFDTASWDPSGRWYGSIKPFASYIDYFFANEAQLFHLTSCRDIRTAAKKLIGDGVTHVVVKLGEQGSILFCPDMSEVRTDAYHIDAVDTTGAGDSFDAAYMLGVSKNWTHKTCGEFANVVAGMNCGRLGATSGVPDYLSAFNTMKTYYNADEKNREEESCH